MLPPILIIQQGEETGGIFRRILENEGYAVLEAGDVDSALRVLPIARPALLLIDAGDGIRDVSDIVESLARRSSAPRSPTIALCRSESEEARARSAGVELTLRKPFAVEMLLEAVRARCPLARHHPSVEAAATSPSRR